VYNDGLTAREEACTAGQPYITDAELSRHVIIEAKTTPERAWLAEVSAVVLQQSLADLNTAYRNYFDSKTGKRKGPQVGRPRYRSRKDRRQAIRFTRNARFSITEEGKLRLPKIGDVEVRWSRDPPAQPSSVTVILDAAGRYFASFCVECGAPEPLPATGRDVGIDLGVTHFAVLSDGRTAAIRRGQDRRHLIVLASRGRARGPDPGRNGEFGHDRRIVSVPPRMAPMFPSDRARATVGRYRPVHRPPTGRRHPPWRTATGRGSALSV
jgi:transposase